MKTRTRYAWNGLRPAAWVGLFIAIALAGTGIASAQKVVRYNGAASSLSDRWSWAKDEAGRQDFGKGFWIGYSIERMMGERSFIGSYHSDERRNHPSLGEMITGMAPETMGSGFNDGSGTMSGNITITDSDSDRPEKMVKKEVGILFHFSRGRSEPFTELKVSNLSLRVDLNGDPLIWAGIAGSDESVTFLDARFRENSSEDIRERCLMAVGIHKESERAMDFLKGVLQGSYDDDLRSDAAFWIGENGTGDALKILTETANNDASEDVREKAIFALSQMEGEEPVDALISIAKGHRNKDTRKHATFWLGEKASRKAIEALKDITYNDEETDVQRSALFALTQIEDGGTVDELIKVARTHPNPKIRKNAIFWLGESEDPKALEALVRMVKGR